MIKNKLILIRSILGLIGILLLYASNAQSKAAASIPSESIKTDPSILDSADQEFIHLYHDEPMHFLMGAPNTKAQISFKAKILQSTEFYVAYTQKIFWDFFKESRPFRDVNYHPALFYRFKLGPDHHNDKENTSLDIVFYDHESNGKAGLQSRSWDRAGIKFNKNFVTDGRTLWTGSVRAWVPYKIEATNFDLPKYRGVYEVVITLSHFMNGYFKLNDLSLRFYSGGNLWIQPWSGGRELTLRLKGSSSAFLATAVFQIFQGYAESLLDYNQSYAGFRVEIGI
jgi:phospholipase A1